MFVERISVIIFNVIFELFLIEFPCSGRLNRTKV